MKKFGSIGSINEYVFPYVMQHNQIDEIERNMRNEAYQMDSNGMIASPDETALLSWMARLIGAKKVLEIGVFRGITTLSLARAVGSDGKVVGIDITDKYLQPMVKYFDQSKMTDRIELRIGNGVDIVTKMIANESNSYDFIFIDADKINYPTYYEASIALCRPGGIIALDNVLWGGRTAAPNDRNDEVVELFQKLNDQIKRDPRVDAVMQVIADGVYFLRKL